MTYTNVVLDKSHLLAFLVKPTTGFTEHYVSSQPLSLYIPYTEYLSLIKDLTSINLDILRTPISVYRGALSAGEYSTMMYRLYHYDIALSGLEEVRRSYRRGFRCTRIFGSVNSNSSKTVNIVGFESAADFVQDNFTEQERQVLHQFIQKNFDIQIGLLWKNYELIDNVHMYFMCMAFLGVYKFGKDFIISVKED